MQQNGNPKFPWDNFKLTSKIVLDQIEFLLMKDPQFIYYPPL